MGFHLGHGSPPKEEGAFLLLTKGKYLLDVWVLLCQVRTLRGPQRDPHSLSDHLYQPPQPNSTGGGENSLPCGGTPGVSHFQRDILNCQRDYSRAPLCWGLGLRFLFGAASPPSRGSRHLWEQNYPPLAGDESPFPAVTSQGMRRGLGGGRSLGATDFSCSSLGPGTMEGSVLCLLLLRQASTHTSPLAKTPGPWGPLGGFQHLSEIFGALTRTASVLQPYNQPPPPHARSSGTWLLLSAYLDSQYLLTPAPTGWGALCSLRNFHFSSSSRLVKTAPFLAFLAGEQSRPRDPCARALGVVRWAGGTKWESG